MVVEGYSFKRAAEAVGVSSRSLREWHEKFDPPPEPCGDNATFEQLQAENKRLRKQLRKARLEREILEKPRRISGRSSSEVRMEVPKRFSFRDVPTPHSHRCSQSQFRMQLFGEIFRWRVRCKCTCSRQLLRVGRSRSEEWVRFKTGG